MFYLIGSFPVSGHYSKCKFHHYILVAPMPTSQPSPLGALLSSHPAMAQHDNYPTQPADIRTQPGRTENSLVLSFSSFPLLFPLTGYNNISAFIGLHHSRFVTTLVTEKMAAGICQLLF